MSLGETLAITQPLNVLRVSFPEQALARSARDLDIVSARGDDMGAAYWSGSHTSRWPCQRSNNQEP